MQKEEKKKKQKTKKNKKQKQKQKTKNKKQKTKNKKQKTENRKQKTKNKKQKTEKKLQIAKKKKKKKTDALIFNKFSRVELNDQCFPGDGMTKIEKLFISIVTNSQVYEDLKTAEMFQKLKNFIFKHSTQK